MEIQSLFPTLTPFTLTTSTTPVEVKIYGLHDPHDASSTSKPPLLLMSGYPQTLAAWHKVVPGLLPHFCVVLLDIRGYGRSSKPRFETTSTSSAKASDSSVASGSASHNLYAKSAMAADAHSVMQQLGHKTYSVLAHDRGARIAHKLAVDHPSAVTRLMVLDICPTLAMYTSTNKLFATAYWHWFFLIQPSPFPEDVILAAPETFARKLLLGFGGVTAEKEIYGEVAWSDYLSFFRDEETVHAWCEDYRASATVDLEEARGDLEAGRKIKCPLGVVWGEFGVIGKLFDARKEWEKVCEEGRVELAVSVKSGHFVPEEAAEELVGLVLGFWGIEA